MFTKIRINRRKVLQSTWDENRIKYNDLRPIQYYSRMIKYIYIAISRLSGKKSIKVHATRPKGGLGIHSNFAYWPGVCIFARGKFVFPLRAYICSFTFTVACL